MVHFKKTEKKLFNKLVGKTQAKAQEAEGEITVAFQATQVNKVPTKFNEDPLPFMNQKTLRAEPLRKMAMIKKFERQFKRHCAIVDEPLALKDFAHR